MSEGFSSNLDENTKLPLFLRCRMLVIYVLKFTKSPELQISACLCHWALTTADATEAIFAERIGPGGLDELLFYDLGRREVSFAPYHMP